MRTYIDDGEKRVARLGGSYSPGVKNAPASLELTDRRIYYSASGATSPDGKIDSCTSSVIDAADVSAITYTHVSPRGKFGLGICLMVLSILAGGTFALVDFFSNKTEELNIMGIVLPLALGVGIGISALGACWLITYLIARNRRVTAVTVEYRGLLLTASFAGVSESKLDEFRQWSFRVKDKLMGRATPPLPDYTTQMLPETEGAETDIRRRADKSDKKFEKNASSKKEQSPAVTEEAQRISEL